jgi:hypothetical protein
MVLVGFWVVGFFGHGASSNPYLGIIFDLVPPAVFIVGLVRVLVGIISRRSYLYATNQFPSFFREVSLKDPLFRHALDIMVVVTLIKVIIVGTDAYRGVAYMDTVSFCGASCRVMTPGLAAYHASSHSNVVCTDCHVALTEAVYIHAKYLRRAPLPGQYLHWQRRLYRPRCRVKRLFPGGKLLRTGMCVLPGYGSLFVQKSH